MLYRFFGVLLISGALGLVVMYFSYGYGHASEVKPRLHKTVTGVIQTRYPGDARKESSLMQAAEAIQESINYIEAPGSVSINEVAKGVFRSVECLNDVFSDANGELAYVESLIMATGDYSKSYDEFNELMLESFFRGYSGEPCDFGSEES